MRARVQKWGNSLALRIPKSFAVEANIRPGTVVDMSRDDNKLVITVGFRDKSLHLTSLLRELQRRTSTRKSILEILWEEKSGSIGR